MLAAVGEHPLDERAYRAVDQRWSWSVKMTSPELPTTRLDQLVICRLLVQTTPIHAPIVSRLTDCIRARLAD